jgi:hypothetical protein
MKLSLSHAEAIQVIRDKFGLPSNVEITIGRLASKPRGVWSGGGTSPSGVASAPVDTFAMDEKQRKQNRLLKLIEKVDACVSQGNRVDGIKAIRMFDGTDEYPLKSALIAYNHWNVVKSHSLKLGRLVKPVFGSGLSDYPEQWV